MAKTTNGWCDLPQLPFELQFQIFRQIPPNRLFVLRRVSHSWNYMLHNQYLLDAINARLPFQTSASDLTSRMKRRMRMARGEPVWVKPFHELVPWASSWSHGPYLRRDDWRWVQYSDGCFAWLSAKDDVRLYLWGFNAQGVVEIEVLAVLKRVNPSVYQRWIERGSLCELPCDPVPFPGVSVSRFHFNVQNGMVVVGLKAELWPDPGAKNGLVLGT